MIILDTETTELLKPEIADLSAQPHIIEIAMIKVDEEGEYAEQDRYEALLNPGVPLDEETHKRITGLRETDIIQCPTFLELRDELCEFVRGEHRLVAHNLPFDLGVLVCELRRIGMEFAFPYPPVQICTVERTKHLLGRRLKLTELYKMKLGRELEQRHRAMSDAEALVEIVKVMELL
jgi:DNA polymerase-3 subunit epsilon